VQHGAAAWERRLEERQHRGGERKEVTPFGWKRILLDQKMKKTHAVNSTTTNDR
jgi:hypothetical protein